MPRSDGFAIMDVSTSICDDPKFRLLHRQRPEHVTAAFMVYVAVLGESWKAGRRVSVTDAWPVAVPFDPEVVTSMIQVRLIERSGLPPRRAWDGWYAPARERRDQSRERWRRANENRRAVPHEDSDDTARLPRGQNDVPLPPSVPTVRPSVPTVPSVPSARARGKKNDDGLTTPTTKEEALLALSARYQRGEMQQLDYERQRKELLAS